MKKLIMTVALMPMMALAGTIGDGLDNTSLVWTTGGIQSVSGENVSWTYNTDDSNGDGDCVVSGAGGAGDATSWLKTTVIGPCTISFYYRFQTYGGSFTFKCDSSTLISRTEYTSRDEPWIYEEHELSSGNHELTWEYHHPGMGFVGAFNGVHLDNFTVINQGSPTPSSPTTWYVNAFNGSDSNSGTRASSAKKTIQAAIDASCAGDTILVAPGTYAPITTANKAITIKSTAGANQTIIDGDNSDRCAHLGEGADDTSTVLDGFKLVNGYLYISWTGAGGAGVRCGTVKNCIVQDCNIDGSWSGYGGEGGGVWGGRLENCEVSNCSALAGGGMCLGSAKNCVFSGNYARDDGGATHQAVSINCLFKDNMAYNTGGQGSGAAGTDATNYNCTVVNNHANSGGIFSGQTTLVNCIIYDNTWNSGSLTYEDSEQHTSMVNCYTDCPSFVDAANGDYRLAAGSPCIDAGDNSYVTATTDLAGNARIANGTVDIGCYEYGASPVGGSLTDGLVAYWPFDGNANDASGNGNHGVVHGATLTTDRFGNANGAYYFDGESYISASDSVSLDTVFTELTIATWICVEDWYDGDWAPIVNKGDGRYTRYYAFNLGTSYASPYNRFGTTEIASEISGEFNQWPELGAWAHVAITYSTDHVAYAYLNGVCVGTYSNSANAFEPNSLPLHIGRDYPGADEYLIGALDDLRIYNRALSAAEVKALYDGTVVTPPTTYKVTFNANGGSVSPASRSVASGAAVGTLPTPTRSGYIFEGWWTAANGGAQVSASTKVTGNITYYAHWAKGTFYTVTFDARGGSLGGASKTRSVAAGSAVGELPTPTHASVKSSDNTWDYEFIGWYDEANNGGSPIDSETIVSSSVTYYACWVMVCRGYVPFSSRDLNLTSAESGGYMVPIVIDAGGGDGITRLIGKWGYPSSTYGKYELPQCPYRRSGYVFAGWKMFDRCYWTGGDSYACVCQDGKRYYFSNGGYRGVYAAGAKVEICGVTAFVAQWREGNAVRLTVKPSSTKYGTVSGGGNYGAGAMATLKAKAKKGYAFAGWFKDKSYKTALNPKGYDNRSPTVKYVVPAADTTVYAKFISKPAAKKSLKFSSATKKLATTPKKVQTGKSLSLALGISSATLVKVTAKGLPKGLSINSKTGKITGTPTKPGTYTVTVTVTDAAGNKITQKVKITVALPSWAKGTFYGYTYSGSSFGRDSRKVTITISSSGKASAKIGDVSLPSKKLSYNTERDCYCFSCVRKGRKVGDRIYSDELSFEVKPNAAWNEDAITGEFYQYYCFTDGGCTAGPGNRDGYVRARKNAAATNAKAKKVAAGCAKIGTQTMGVSVQYTYNNNNDYNLDCPNCGMSDSLERVYVKTDKNGRATLSGSIAGTRVSGTAYLEYNVVASYEDIAFARFFSGNFIVEIIYLSAKNPYTPIDGSTYGWIWKRE